MAPLDVSPHRALAFVLAAVSMVAGPTPAPAKDPLVFVTAFAPGEKGGIHAYEFDTAAGTLRPLRRTAGVENPFFLALSPDRKFLYSIHAKQFGGKENEQVAAYQVVGRQATGQPPTRARTQSTAGTRTSREPPSRRSGGGRGSDNDKRPAPR